MMFLTVQVAAQSRGLLIGDQWMRMNSGGNQYEVFDLPAHAGSDPGLYTGQTSQNSQFVQLTPNGDLLFFIMDGRIYDRLGQRIGFPECNDCLYPGKTQILAAPVPGHCNMYYLLSVVPDGIFGPLPQFQVALLDMDHRDENEPGCGSLGRLVPWTSFTEHLDPESPYNFLENFLENGNYVPIDNHIMALPMNNTAIKAKRVTMSLYDPGWQDGTLLYHVVTSHHVSQYRLGSAGITEGWVYVYDNSAAAGEERWPHDAAFGLAPTANELRYAWTNCEDGSIVQQQIGISQGNPIKVTMLRMNPANGDLLPSPAVGYNPSDDACGPKIYGCAFTPDGLDLLFTRSSNVGGVALGQMNLATGAVTDMGDIFGMTPAQAAPFVTTHIERGTMPDGTGATYFYGHATNVAMLQWDPVPANCTWFPALPATAAFNFVPQANAPIAYDPPYLLNAGIVGTAQQDFQGSQACCASMARTTAWDGSQQFMVQNALNNPWLPGNNPFSNGTEVVFCGDVVVQAGSNLFVRDMVWRFTEDARLIVEPGARLRFDNCTITGLCAAPWRGIRVEGVTSHPLQGLVQGALHLVGTTIADAHTGVYCARENANGTIDPSGFGGYVRAFNSTFRNNRVGVHVGPYLGSNSFGSLLANRCQLDGCTFTFDADHPFDAPLDRLYAHVWLRNVRNVRIINCDLRNDAPMAFGINDRGHGILAANATFICQGGSNYAQHGFRNLSVGVLAMSTPGFWAPYTVNGMAFHNNRDGIFDMFRRGSRITNNQFITLEHPEPLTGPLSRGLGLYQSEGYIVERNTFQAPSQNAAAAGIHFLGNSYQDNEIYNNQFDDLVFGCVVEGQHVAEPIYNSVQSFPGLQMRCGDHLNNQVDQYIMDNSYIRRDQGSLGAAQNLANNRFFSTVPCDPEAWPAFHIEVGSSVPYGLWVQYYYYGFSANPEHRPDCIEDEFGVPQGTTGEFFYDLINSQQTLAFNKEEDCGHGVVEADGPSGPGPIGNLPSIFATKNAELQSAIAVYEGTVDRGGRPDLLAAIAHQPWHPSYTLRELLYAHHPLSDDVLKAAIMRPEPMDPWHLTQVLIQNSRISPYLWELLHTTQVLPPYFMALLEQMQDGHGLRHVLEQEVLLRQQEVAFVRRRLLTAYGQDSTVTSPVDSVLAMYAADSLGDGLRMAYLIHLEQEDWSAAGALAPLLLQDERTEDVVAVGQIYARLEGDWTLANGGDVDLLYQIAYDQGSGASAMAWATLLELGVTDSLPMLHPPSLQRSQVVSRPRRVSLPATPMVGVLPNPATDRIAFTYPQGAEDGMLEVLDMQGRMVRSLPLLGRKGLLESHVRDLPAGMYAVRLVVDGMVWGHNKFTVVR